MPQRNTKMESDELFLEDDLEPVYKQYFADIVENDRTRLNPSGWVQSYTEVINYLPEFSINWERAARYCVDDAKELQVAKEEINYVLSLWSDHSLSYDEITYSHSGGLAILTVLVTLMGQGVHTMLFETPNYFAGIAQANELKQKVKLIPTYKATDFKLEISKSMIREHSPCAVWICQPKMSLGYDHDVKFVENLLDSLGPQDYLIIDEVNEQRFPISLSAIKNDHPNLIRIRSFFKSMGLNGLKLSYIVHDPRLREEIMLAQVRYGGSLNVTSLEVARCLADADRLKKLLMVANRQVVRLRKKAEEKVINTPLEVSKLVNGNIGSLHLNMESLPGGSEAQHPKLLQYCQQTQMPVFLGRNMAFARDPKWEMIRMNYFMQESDILGGIDNILEYYKIAQ